MAVKRPLKLRSTGMIFTAALLATCASSVVIPPAMPGEEPKLETGRDPIAIYKEAGIDAEQEVKIRNLATEYERDSAEKANAIVQLLREMRHLSLDPELDAKKIMDTQKEINKLQGVMAIDKVQLLIRIRSQLRTDQKRKLVALLQKARSKDAQAAP